MKVRPEFDLNNDGSHAAASACIVTVFSDCLDELDRILGVSSREQTLLITKLQEAHFWAQLAASKSTL